MTRTYSMRWIENKSAYQQLVIEDGDGCPAFVMDIWWDSERNVFLSDVQIGLTQNYESDALDEALIEAKTETEAKQIAEKWLLEAWGLEKAFRAYYDQESAYWAEDNQDSLVIGACWWRQDEHGDLVFRVAIPQPDNDKSKVITAGRIYRIDNMWLGLKLSRGSFGLSVDQAEEYTEVGIFDTFDQAKAAVKKAVAKDAVKKAVVERRSHDP